MSKRKLRLLTTVSPSSNPNCLVCGQRKTLKLLKGSREETLFNLMRRKTCGKEWDGKRYVPSDCYSKFMSGKGNPNYKGYMPKCVICKKRIAYNNAEDMRKGKIPKYCLEHAKESWKNGELHEITTAKNRKQGLKMKGKVTEHLRPYLFKKGLVPFNKKYTEESKCIYCNKKPVARNMCYKHWKLHRA